MIIESLLMSWRNIINNKMRSFLTVLGVLIGVASIIAIISIVQGVTENITSQVMDMGANKISIQSKGTYLKKGLTINDLYSIEEIDNIQGVSPGINGMTEIYYDGKIMDEISILGKNEVHFKNTQDLLESGRPIYKLDVDNKNQVCLIGNDIVEEYFKTESPINKKIVVGNMEYTIIGTLQKSNDFAAGSNDKSIIIPYTTAMKLIGTGYISSLDIYVADENKAEETTDKIESVLKSSFNSKDDGYIVTNMKNILDTVSDMTGTMTLMLGGIAFISLVVGGIGIMNMMLVTVTERTAEIGLRKALGAEPKTIQLQFLLEALFLSLFGGIIGLGAGLILAYIASILLGIEFIVVGYSVFLAIGFSSLIGLIFGYSPARKASKLNPIDALRSA